jgi:hypothetical protein
MTKINEEILTPELLDRLKQSDVRFADLDLRLKIEKELRDSICLKVIFDACSEQSAIALEQLAEVDPTDVKKIVHLQAIVQRTRFIARTLNKTIQRGEMAEQSLNDEQSIELNDPTGENNDDQS